MHMQVVHTASKKLGNLRQLLMGGTSVDVPAVKLLAEAMVHFEHLEYLDLYSHSLNKESATCLAAALAHCKCLRHLNIASSHLMIRDEAFEPLIPVLKKLTGLVSVVIGGSFLSEGCFKRMLSALVSCKGLYKLRIKLHGDMMPEMLQLLKPKMSKFKKLAWLELTSAPHPCSEHAELLGRLQAVWQATVAAGSTVRLLARHDGLGAALHCSRRQLPADVLRTIACGAIEGPDVASVGVVRSKYFDVSKL